MQKRLLYLVALCALLSGCDRGVDAGAALQSVTVRTQPPQATVSVGTSQGSLVAVLEGQGPLASFALPEGHYSFEVRAPGFVPFEGSFGVPENKNLAVWLEPR